MFQPRKITLIFLVAPFLGSYAILSATETNSHPYNMSFEELAQITFTSVAGIEKSFWETPSAISVISPEDIRKQGHKTLADALRTVPGMHVGQFNSQNYAIAARGFTDRFSNKMLVMIDGRTVYTPTISGVFWDIQDTVLADIERIEVIRGPGATLWGANAVNGVVNIITKSSFETKGNLLTVGGGTFEQGFVTFRHGGEWFTDTAYRIYGKFFNRDNTIDQSGHERPDDNSLFRGGFRLDHNLTDDDTLTLQGDYARTDHNGEAAATVNPLPPVPLLFPGQSRQPVAIARDAALLNGHLMVNWTRKKNLREGLRFKSYFDYEQRDLAAIYEDTTTVDIDFRQWFGLNENNDFIYGFGWRTIKTDIEGTFDIDFVPAERRQHLFSTFIQNSTRLGDRFTLIYGSKFEHNDITGFEFQPSIRLSFLYSDSTQLWFSVARAVRTPSVAEEDIVFRRAEPIAPGLFANIVTTGNDNAPSEELFAWETGIRSQISNDLIIDLSAFYNDYDHLGVFEPTAGDPFVFEYSASDTAEAYGLELQIKYNINERWEISASYSYYNQESSGSGEGTSEVAADYAPNNMANLVSSYQLAENFAIHAAFYYYDNVGGGIDIPAYVKADLGFSWRINDKIDLQVWGKNLLEPAHLEFRDNNFEDEPHEIERSIFAQLTYRF